MQGCIPGTSVVTHAGIAGIRKSIKEQSEKLKATLELAQQCEKSVSRLAQVSASLSASVCVCARVSTG
jgi:hypothetical protein